jgi:NodT family efflux transporter outer membrane factor (OMF) lipoprotein
VKSQSVFVVALCALVLAGCRVGPEHVAPTPVVELDRFASGGAEPVGDLAAWWRAFEDPQLDALVAQALAANHDLAAAAERVASARAVAAAARGANEPALAAGAERQWLRASSEAAGLAGAGVSAGLVERRQDSYRVGLDASWELDLFGAVQRRAESAAARADVAEAQLHGVRLVVAAQTAAHYLSVRYLEQRLDVAERLVANLAAHVERSAAAVASGLATSDELEAAKLALARARATPPALVSAIAAERHALAVLVGVSPSHFTLAAATDATSAPHVPRAIALGVPGELLRRRPDLVAAEREVAVAAAALGVATADLYPRLVLLGGVGFDAQSADELIGRDALAGFVGPALTLPLLQGGALRRRVDAARAEHRAAALEFQGALLAALADVESAAAAYRADLERIEHATAARAAAAGALRANEERRASGLVDTRAVLAAEREHLSACDALAALNGAAAASAARLWKALGGGSAAAEELARR